MATQHQIDTTRLGKHLWVAIALTQPTQMRDANDKVALFTPLEQLHHVVGHTHGVEIFYGQIVFGHHQTFQRRVEGKDTNLQSLALDDGIGLDHAIKRCAREIIIGAENGEMCHLENAHHIVNAKVKLVVANGCCIIVHAIHQPYFHFTLEECVIR